MAGSGWYPDPGGSPGRYRYWDGSRWSAETTDDPTTARPPTGPTVAGATTSGAGTTGNGATGDRRRSRGGRTALLIGALVVVVALILVVVGVVRSVSGQHVLAEPARLGILIDRREPGVDADDLRRGERILVRPEEAAPGRHLLLQRLELGLERAGALHQEGVGLRVADAGNGHQSSCIRSSSVLLTTFTSCAAAWNARW